jgi:hypothetical protein
MAADSTGPATETAAGVHAGDFNPELLAALKARLQRAIDEHNVWLDPVVFNGGTALTLGLTAFAGVLPVIDHAATWLGPLCSALAGVLIALERALGTGARWRFHRDMRSSYASILDMLDFYPILPPSERPKYVRDVFAALYAVRSRESAIPNAGVNAQPT